MAGIAENFQQVGVTIGNNLFARLDLLNPADLHKPDLVHNIYLGLFKDMLEWVEGFPKKDKRRQVFDDAGKQIRSHPGLSVPKKADRDVTEWQFKEMRNLVRYIWALLVSALQNLESSHYHDFKSPLKCFSTVVDLCLMAQYRSHRPDTLVYMERYLQTFQRIKDIFPKFHTSKATRAEANCHDRDVRELMVNQGDNQARHNTSAKRRRQVDQERLARANQRADLTQGENHFNFIKRDYRGHFAFHVWHFGSISM